MGWSVLPEEKTTAFGLDRDFTAMHLGAGTGTSGALLIVPGQRGGDGGSKVSGVVVAVLCNMEGPFHAKLAMELAKMFKGCAESAENVTCE